MPAPEQALERSPSQDAAKILTDALQKLQTGTLKSGAASAVTRIGRAVQFVWQIEGRGTSPEHTRFAEQAIGLIQEAMGRLDNATPHVPLYDEVIKNLKAAERLLRPRTTESGLLRLQSGLVTVPPIATRLSSMPPNNRRESLRVPLEVGVGFLSETNFYMGLTEDISEGGLFVATWEWLPIGTKVRLKFGIPGGTDMYVDGVVRWVRERASDEDSWAVPGMGIQFLTLPEPAKNAIDGFIAQRAPLFYEEGF